MEQGKMYGQQDSIDVRMYDRDKAIPVLVELSAVTKDLSPLLRQQIQEAAIEGLHDSNGLVRRDAIEAVSQFGTLEMIPFLEDIARADPYSRVKDGKQFFPRREAAAKAIRSIQERAVKAPTP